MSHLHESWKLHDWRFLPRSTSTGCRKLPKSTTSSMARVPRPREDPNQDPVAAVAVMVVVWQSQCWKHQKTHQIRLEKVGRFHYLVISVGGVENLDTRKVNSVRPWKQSAEAVEQKGTMRRCV